MQPEVLKGEVLERVPEYKEINWLVKNIPSLGSVELQGKVEVENHSLPLYSFQLGSKEKTAPTLVLVAGVHGLERIGTRVLLAYLQTLTKLTNWDPSTRNALSHCRLLAYPIVNPAGFYLRTRSNANGIDLMRNAPVEGKEIKKWNLLAGQRFSKHLPWYRGNTNEPMAYEAKTLCDFIERECFESPLILSVDVHSGFGAIDRLWFPFAHSKEVFPEVEKVCALKELFDETFPNHVYRIEPQNLQYTTHGDLWDYLYEKHSIEHSSQTYIPFSLEMGSWLWIRKNPKQLFSALGPFNPILPHRLQRTLRRHLTLFDFLLRVTNASAEWLEMAQSKKTLYRRYSRFKWYGR